MKNKFNFNRSEKTGIIALSIIILVLILILNIPTNSILPDIFDGDTTELEYYQEKPRLKKEYRQSKKHIGYKKEKINYKSFNPNNYLKSDWQKIGFSEKQAGAIIRYKKSIKQFKSISDLEKCYVISSKKLNAFKSFVYFEEKDTLISKRLINPKSIEIKELNALTENELLSIKGIGAVLSKRIISYKNKLGGFFELTQLKEVYGLSDDNYNLMVNQLYIDSTKILKIDVKSSSFNELKKHPYVNWSLAQEILIWRKDHIHLELIERLKDTKLFSDKEINKITPYISE